MLGAIAALYPINISRIEMLGPHHNKIGYYPQKDWDELIPKGPSERLEIQGIVLNQGIKPILLWTLMQNKLRKRR